jgi:DNA-directed RNA polymerase specialized sigma24 family protein
MLSFPSHQDQAKEWFHAFCKQYGGWLRNQAQTIAQIKKKDACDVEQDLLEFAWRACTNPKYDPDLGKTPIGWVYQRLCWVVLTWLSTPIPPEILYEDLAHKSGNTRSSLEFLDVLIRNNEEIAPRDYDYLEGSRTATKNEQKIHGKSLIERILVIIKDLPEKYRTPLAELLQPSPAFLNFLEDKNKQHQRNATNQNTGEEYVGACKFEICSASDIAEFTGVSVFHLQVAIRFVRKHIPELECYKEEIPESRSIPKQYYKPMYKAFYDPDKETTTEK